MAKLAQVIIVYIPVLHKGYVQFLEKHADVRDLYLLGENILAEFPHLRKDIRALTPEQVAQALPALGIKTNVQILDHTKITELQKTSAAVLFPDEDIFHELAAKYFADHAVSYDTVFLRWDSQKALEQQQINADEEITNDELAKKFMKFAQAEAQKSADWWRRVGAVIAKNGEVVLAGYNQHVPSYQQPYFDGDARGNFHKGQHIELTTAFHAEAHLIAEAAKAGTSLTGAEIYVTTFPCPNCAKLIAYSGLQTVYFEEGYAMVDGESILKAQSVKIVRVTQ